MEWTDDRVAKLKKLWADGINTGLIAKTLGVSRDAVIGKANRLKCGRHVRAIPALWTVETKKITARMAHSGSDAEEISKTTGIPLKNVCKHIAGLQLVGPGGGCQWPEGTSVPYLFCGGPVQHSYSTSAYCAHHLARAYRPRRDDGNPVWERES